MKIGIGRWPAEFDLGETELSTAGGIAKVAGCGEHEAAAEAVTVNVRDEDLREIGYSPTVGGSFNVEFEDLLFVQLCRFLYIVAGAEGFAFTSQDHDADTVLRDLQPFGEGDLFVRGLGVDCIEPVRAIEGDFQGCALF